MKLTHCFRALNTACLKGHEVAVELHGGKILTGTITAQDHRFIIRAKEGMVPLRLTNVRRVQAWTK